MAQKLFSQDEKYISKKAAGALTAYLFVVEDTDTAEVDVAGADAAACGVVDADYDSGHEAVRVVYAGITYVIAGGTVAVGAFVSSDSAGKAVAHGTSDNILGRAMSAGAAGSLMSVLLLQSVDTPSA